MSTANKYYFREGWTERIRFALTINGGTVLDVSGMTIALVGKDRLSNDLTFTGSVGASSPTTGIVYFDPATSDLKESNGPYRLRWKVTDSNGKVAYFPNAEPMTWIIDQP